jgi:WD40 repeat protein
LSPPSTSTDDKLKSLLKHGSLVYSVTFNKDGILVSGGGNGRVKFWDIKTGNEEGILFHPYYENSTMRLAFSKAGKSFIPTSDKRVFVWNLDFDNLVQQGCQQVSGYLKNSLNVSQSDKILCDQVPKPQPSQQ